MTTLEQRVASAAEESLVAQGYVSAVDVLLGLSWLPSPRLDEWRQGRHATLEETMHVAPGKLTHGLELFHCWAEDRGLVACEVSCVARTRDRRQLRFSDSGVREVERAYRTHWMSATLSDAQRGALVERLSRAPELVVISPLKDWTCVGCSGTGDLLLMQDDQPVCMTCAQLDHLVFLPAGDAGLTRRAHRASDLSAVVVRFSSRRRRYERQGLLVEPAALASAERQ